jgi:RNA polymerase sigma-70 factor (ECF subfamily)
MTSATPNPEPTPRQRLSDDVLVLRLARSDRPAYDEVYRRYARPAYGLALAHAADHEHAEHATREVFRAIWTEAPHFDPAVAVADGWIHEVALTAIRRHLERSPEAAAAVREPSDPDAERRRWQVYRALADLAPDEAAIVELVTWGGLQLHDAALYLGVPPETARARACAGLARLELPGGPARAGGAPSAAGELLDGLDRAGAVALERAQTTLLEVGAPPELPPTLHDPPEPGGSAGVRRYRFTALAAALAVGAVLFGAGYVVGGGGAPDQAVETVGLTGLDTATADVLVLARDAAGNWPIELTVRGLPALEAGLAYELRVIPAAAAGGSAGPVPVGRFRTATGRSVTVRLSTPADVADGATWIIGRASRPGEALLRGR